MPSKQRPCIITGNWKMHKTIEEACLFVETLAPKVTPSQAAVYLAVPFTALYSVVKTVERLKLPFEIGGQNMHDAENGAFTGEVSAEMLKEAGADFVLLGHSERRHLFGETNAFINRKVKRALKENLQPVLCVGESEQQRAEKKTEDVLKSQILESLNGVSDLGTLILAYEPVWAIGTGKVASAEDANQAHSFCRKVIAQKWDRASAEKLIIQYGGSVKPDNAAELLKQEDIDGLLVGGASLSVETFSQIVNAYKKVRL